MPNLQQQRRLECLLANCKYDNDTKTLCMARWGNACKVLGGNKIPRQRTEQNEKRKRPKQDLFHNMKPYFMAAGDSG